MTIIMRTQLEAMIHAFYAMRPAQLTIQAKGTQVLARTNPQYPRKTCIQNPATLDLTTTWRQIPPITGPHPLRPTMASLLPPLWPNLRCKIALVAVPI